jgi:hypothetical protein
MLVYILGYLIAGAVVSLAHPRIRRHNTEFWRAKATGITDIIQKVFFGCLLFLFTCVLWPIVWIIGSKALKKEKNHFNELLNDPHIRKINPLFHAMLQLSADGTEADEIPESVGEFGLTPTNPIPTVNVFGNRAYLDRLGTSDGRVVYHARRGSVVPEGSKRPVDIYDLTDQQGNYVGAIYICPYHRKNSEKTPAGFRFR